MTQAISPGMGSAVSGVRPARLVFWGAGLAFSLLVGALLYTVAARTVEGDARQRFNGIARGAQSALAARLATFNDLVRGTTALFEASDEPVTRLQFHRYVAALDIERNFPEVELMSFNASVDDAGRDDFVAAVRADRSLRPDGYPDFDIGPPGRRPHYQVRIYVEPARRFREYFGADLMSNPTIARALAHGRDTGRISSSGVPVRFDAPSPHIGLGIGRPVYRKGMPLQDVAARRAAFLGTVGVEFSVPGLAQGVLGRVGMPDMHLALYAARGGAAGGPLAIAAGDRLLFDGGARAGDDSFEAVLPVGFNGNLWKARFSLPPAALYSQFDRAFPFLALAIGLVVGLLVYSLFFTLFWSRRAAVAQRVLLDTVLDSVDAHVYMKDRERRYTYINARTAAAMGRQPHEVIGRFDRDVLPAALADAYWEQDRSVFENGVHTAVQYQFTQLDGEVRQFWTVKVPVMEAGEVAAVIGLSTDVTELHDLKAQADAASLAKSNFLSNMSHEIRTPMNSIIGMTHLALKSAATPKQRDYLEKIYHSSQHLLGIINDILDFSKIEAGRLDLEVIDFSLATLMENIAHQLGGAAEARGLALEFDIAPGLPRQLRGDPLRLEQVLLNFTGNAIKFSQDGVVRIGVGALDDSEHDTLVRFEVRDHGIGMTAAEVGELFKAFHQADPSTTRKYGGTGLGLVISKQLVELMGGSVGVDSAPGAGSTFWFTARLAKGVKFARAVPEPVRREVLDQIAGARILLVEDNLFSQQVGQELLEEASAIVVVAGNGKEAIDVMLRRRFDCVLMDLQMPVMDGFETTRMIRSDPRLRDAVVIAMTANAGRDDQARALAAGMNEFVTKPTSPNQLFDVIARCLRARAPAAVEAPAARAGAAEPAAAPMFDMGALSLTFGGNPDKMRKYAFMFLDSARDGLAVVGEALARGDIERAADTGHRMKSAARAVGAMAFAQLCQGLEDLRGGGSVAEANVLLKRMVALRELLTEHMATELGEPAPG
ncbi:MAG: CHASE domain-containing protein [Pseudomonadota bacterium]